MTDLLDHQAYPAQALAAAYPWRWTGSETTFKENKSTITDAGPSRGPILRSRTPDLVLQEFWAWLTATDLTRAAGRAAAAVPPTATPTHPIKPLPARAVSFTATLREIIRYIVQTRDPIKEEVARTLRAQRIQLDRHRYRARVTDQVPPGVPQRQARHRDRHRQRHAPRPVGPPRTRRHVTHPPLTPTHPQRSRTPQAVEPWRTPAATSGPTPCPSPPPPTMTPPHKGHTWHYRSSLTNALSPRH